MTNHNKPSDALRSLRARNRSLVIDVLRHEDSASRAEIARRTGLSRATISSLGSYALPAAVQAVSVAAGAVGERAALLGALALVISKTTHQPTTTG
jgi:hypothetical protein